MNTSKNKTLYLMIFLLVVVAIFLGFYFYKKNKIIVPTPIINFPPISGASFSYCDQCESDKGKVQLRGSGLPGNNIVVKINSQVVATGSIDASGNYDMWVHNLSEGRYVFSITQTDSKGNSSAEIKVPIDVGDTRSPEEKQKQKDLNTEYDKLMNQSEKLSEVEATVSLIGTDKIHICGPEPSSPEECITIKDDTLHVLSSTKNTISLIRKPEISKTYKIINYVAEPVLQIFTGEDWVFPRIEMYKNSIDNSSEQYDPIKKVQNNDSSAKIFSSSNGDAGAYGIRYMIESTQHPEFPYLVSMSFDWDAEYPDETGNLPPPSIPTINQVETIISNLYIL